MGKFQQFEYFNYEAANEFYINAYHLETIDENKNKIYEKIKKNKEILVSPDKISKKIQKLKDKT